MEIRFDLYHVPSKDCSDENEKPTDENDREPYFWLMIKIVYEQLSFLKMTWETSGHSELYSGRPYDHSSERAGLRLVSICLGRKK